MEPTFMSPPGASAPPRPPRRPRGMRVLVLAFFTAATAGALAPGSTGGATAPPAAAAPRASAADGRVSLKGEIVDLGCYLMHEGRGDTHVACAQACVKAGAPVGLLAGGALYVLFAPHETTAPFEEAKRLVGRSATVTGIVHGRGGLRGFAVTMVAARAQGDVPR